MRKWVIFVWLKVAEATAASAGVYMVYALGGYLNHWRGSWLTHISTGLLVCMGALFVTALAFVIIFIAIPHAIRINIEWAKKIDQKLFGGK